MLSKREKISRTHEAAAFEAMVKTCAFCLNVDQSEGFCIYNDCPVFDNLKWTIDIIQDLDIELTQKEKEKEIRESEHAYRSIGEGIE